MSSFTEVVYAEKKIGDIDRKIKQTSFLSAIKPSEIMYTSDGFELFLYLKSTKVSYVRGAIGLQPNPVSQKMALTGELNLKLENALKKGELLKFNWRSIKPQTQRMPSKQDQSALSTGGLPGSNTAAEKPQTDFR